MEKKIYFAPDMKVYDVKATELLAGSLGLGNGETGTMHAKQSLLDVIDGDGEYTNIGFDIYETTE